MPQTINELSDYLRAGQPIYYINTPEEERAVNAIRNTGWCTCPRWTEAFQVAAITAATAFDTPYAGTTAQAAVDLYRRCEVLHDEDATASSLVALRDALNASGAVTHCWEQLGGLNGTGQFAGEFVEFLVAIGNRTAFDVTDRTIVVLKDADVYLRSDQSVYRRALRNLYESNKLVCGDTPIHLIFLQPRFLPAESIRHCMVRLDFDLPNEDDISAIVSTVQAGISDATKRDCSQNHRREICRSLLGLDQANCEKALCLAVVQFGGFRETILTTKNGEPATRRFSSSLRKMRASQLSSSQGITILDPESDAISSIGDLQGYENVWELANDVKFATTETAAKLGIRSPSGMALMGPPGTGKTCAAKLFARWLGWPLVSVNVGKAKGGIVGESEANMAACLDVVRAMGECVALFDEFDKQSGGVVNGGASDGNTSANMLSLILDFASDPNRKAFLIFTMNRLSCPLESLRAGRISRFFFTPLPDKDGRHSILKLKLEEYGADIPPDLGSVAEDRISDKMTGAELTEMVNTAVLLAARTRGKKNPTASELIAAKSLITAVSKLDPVEMDAINRFQAIAVPVGKVRESSVPKRRSIRGN